MPFWILSYDHCCSHQQFAYLSDVDTGIGQICATFTPLRASLLPRIPKTSAPASRELNRLSEYDFLHCVLSIMLLQNLATRSHPCQDDSLLSLPTLMSNCRKVKVVSIGPENLFSLILADCLLTSFSQKLHRSKAGRCKAQQDD